MRSRKLVTILLSLILLIAACGDDANDGEGGVFDPEIRDVYVADCATVQPLGFCECVIDQLQQNMTQDEFVTYAIERQGSEDLPDAIVQAGFACLGAAELDD